jgi:hypothetical protein
MRPDRLGFRDRQQGLEAFVSSGTGFFETVPRLSHIAVVKAVNPNYPGINVSGHFVSSGHIGGPDPRL